MDCRADTTADTAENDKKANNRHHNDNDDNTVIAVVHFALVGLAPAVLESRRALEAFCGDGGTRCPGCKCHIAREIWWTGGELGLVRRVPFDYIGV